MRLFRMLPAGFGLFAIHMVLGQVSNRLPSTTLYPLPTTAPVTQQASTATFPSGLPVGMMGASYPLNQPINGLPVDTRLIAAAYGGNGQATATDTVDHHVKQFSSSYNGSSPNGLLIDPAMPYSVVNSVQHPELLVTVAYSTAEASFPNESDSLITDAGTGIQHTRPIPVKGCTIEDPGTPSADHHCLVEDAATGLDYEMWRVARDSSGNMSADQVTIWNLATGKRVSDNHCDTVPCTSADAAGLPILPYIARYEDFQYAIDHGKTDLGHALRMTLDITRSDFHTAGWFIPPATHAAGGSSTIGAVEGQRYRIPASVTKPTGLSPFDNILWNTLSIYGAVLADNGSRWLFTGDMDPRWNGNVYNFTTITNLFANQMETVNNGCWTNANGDTNGTLATPC